MKLTFLAILGSLLFVSGCGDSSNSSATVRDNSNNIGTNTRMEKDTPYAISRGDEIEKISNPVIELSSDLKSGKTVAILKSGEAAIIKK